MDEMTAWEKLINVFNQMRPADYLDIDVDDYIYHYTSPNGLEGIIKTKSLWATNMLYLNDSAERIYVLDLIMEEISELCVDEDIKCTVIKAVNQAKANIFEKKVHSYVVSFTLDGDSLVMWDYYTKGLATQGYAIRFNRSIIDESIRIRTGAEPDKTRKQLIHWRGRVVYEKNKQIEILKRVFNAFINQYKECDCAKTIDALGEYIVEKALFIGHFFKSEMFAVEQEYRIVFATYLLKGNENQGIPSEEKFRLHNGIFIPYLECQYNPEAIEEIVFSPTLWSRRAEASLERLLNANDIETKISESQISLRY